MGPAPVVELLGHFTDEDGRLSHLVSELNELSRRVQAADASNPLDPAVLAGRKGPLGELAALDRRSTNFYSGTTTAAMPRGSAGGAPSLGRHGHGHSLAAMQQSTMLTGGGGSVAGSHGSRLLGGSASGAAPGGGVVGLPVKVEEVALPIPPTDSASLLPAPPGNQEWGALQASVNDACGRFEAPNAKMGWKQWALTRPHAALLVSLFWWTICTSFQSDHPMSSLLCEWVFGHFCRHYVATVLTVQGRKRDQYQQVWIDMMSDAVIAMLAGSFPRSAHKFNDDLRQLVRRQLRLWTSGTLPADMHPSVHDTPDGVAPAAAMTIARVVKHLAGPAGADSADPALMAALGWQRPPPQFSQQHRPRQQHAVAGASSSRALPSAPTPQSPAPPVVGLLHPGATMSMRRSKSLSAAASAAVAAVDGGERPVAAQQPQAPPQQQQQQHAGPGRGGFETVKNSPIVMHAFEEHGLGNPSAYKTLRKSAIGTTQQRMHRPLDEGAEEELSYRTMAQRCTSAAAQAVDQYTASKARAKAEVAALRRQWVSDRDAITDKASALAAAPTKVKATSNRLSEWLQNDTERILSDQPICTEPQPGPSGARAYRPSRFMAPLHHMRQIENNIHALTGRHDSTDATARVHALRKRADGEAAARWRPMAEFKVGTKDSMLHTTVKKILFSLDVQQYL